MSFNPDDPKYTAYALGELDENERAAIDAELKADPAVAAAVGEIRTTTLRLSAALQAEPLPTSGAFGSASAAPAGEIGVAVDLKRKPARRMVSWKVAIGGLVAIAGCALVAGLITPATNNAPQTALRSAAMDESTGYRENQSLNQLHPIGVGVTNFEDKRYVFSAEAANSWHDRRANDEGVEGINGAFREGYNRMGWNGAASGTSQSKPINFNGGTLSKSGADTLSLGGNTTNVIVGADNTSGVRLNYANKPLGNFASDTALFANPYTGATTVTNGTLTISSSQRYDESQVPISHLRQNSGKPLSEDLVNRIVDQDPQVVDLSKAMSQFKMAMDNAITKSRNPEHDPTVRTYRAQYESLQRQRDALLSELRPQIAAQVQQMQNPAGAGGESEHNTESYAFLEDNRFLAAAENPLSTFSIDVDTASYSNIRRFLLQQNQLPPPGAVRIEEMINYFRYQYPQPEGDKPFSVTTEVASCPWAAEHRLVRIGLKGRELEHRPPSNLVFLIDVSGSMEEPAKLPLVQASLKMLTQQLGENDHVAIVVYAGNSGLVLPSTRGDKHEEIIAAIERLRAGGSSNGGQGIELAYEIACQNILKGGVNRVILATDGDFNVGVTNQDALVRLIQDKAKTGVFLTTLGFGYGNLKDSTMQMLADKGNGNNYYIDDLAEARKVLVEQIGGTLVTIAKDVKLQIEFNPAEVAEYRLIGYEKRILAKEDFNDDKKDAGEIGAGHTVTALYEIVPAGGRRAQGAGRSEKEGAKAEEAAQTAAAPDVDPLKYQRPASLSDAAKSGELFTLKLRYKQPDGDKSTLMETPVKDAGTKYGQASADFKFAAAVASFGMILRDSPYKGNATLAAVKELAQEGVGKADEKSDSTYRAEFVQLIEKAKSLKGP
jgi:Ca-activated chloride channel family protein